MMNTPRNKDRKATPKDKIISGFAVLAIGICMTANASGSSFRYSSFYPGTSSGNSFIFVIFLVALVSVAVKVFRMEEQGRDDGLGPVKNVPERPKHEEKPASDPTSAPAAVNAEKSREKKIVYCPYCGTAQKEDYMVCESCGAGRKK